MNSFSARSKTLSVADLHADHVVGQAHATHVTTRALRMFGPTRKKTGVPVRDRRILETTGRRPDIIGPDDTILQFTRRLMYTHYQAIRDNDERALKEAGEPLHDLRGAMRRLRILLRILRRPLRSTSAAGLEVELSELLRVFGRTRDLDVWIEMLESPPFVAALNGNHPYEAYVAGLRSFRARRTIPASNALKTRYRRLCARLSRFIRAELETNPAHTNALLQGFARRQFKRAVRRIRQSERVALDTPSENLHVYRKAVRRARYIAEFFAPLLGPWGQAAERQLTRMSTELGLIHDIDLGIQRLRRDFPDSPAELQAALLTSRGKAVKCFKGLRRQCRNLKWYHSRNG